MAAQYLDPSQYAQYSTTAPSYSLPPPQHYNTVPQMADNAYGQRHQNPPSTASNPLASKSGVQDGKEFSLVVQQQPDRARMCGFGDKDRRPITPPPCVELVIKDKSTGRTVHPNDVDFVPYVLNVDLWDGEGRREVNLVRSSNSAPTMSISMATTTSYPPPPDPPSSGHVVPVFGPNNAWTYHMLNPGMHQPAYGAYPQPIPQHPYSMPRQNSYTTPAPPHSGPGGTGMFTRNLIGSVTVSAASLLNLEGRPGCWFVLQDLSVRQEGTFRLKLSFINVGGATQGSLNTGACPILAETFSEPFTVWSAKKFPGVKESTQLSKCFASQGVKIPIRKDNSKGGGKDDPDDDEYARPNGVNGVNGGGNHYDKRGVNGVDGGHGHQVGRGGSYDVNGTTNGFDGSHTYHVNGIKRRLSDANGEDKENDFARTFID